MENKNRSYPKKLFLSAILVIAIFFRLWGLQTQEVMTDEGNYAMRAIGWNDFMHSGSLTTPWNWFSDKDVLPLWTKLSFNDHPPLHFFSIWLSTHIFGVSLWTVRLPSVIFGILSVFLIYMILKEERYDFGAYCGALFMSILPWHIYISRQAIQESQVMFWILMSMYLSLKLVKSRGEKNIIWILLGISLGLGMITKYSMIIILPLFIYYFFAKKWYAIKYFYLMVFSFIVVVSPVIYYNIKVFHFRGHFDLQISRFFKLDTTKDWLASKQEIWQGNVMLFFDFYKNLFLWASFFAMLIILLGLYLYGKELLSKKKSDDGAMDYFMINYAMILFASIIIILTLPDSGRSSIIIPFLALAFGAGMEKVVQYKNIYLHSISIICFIILGAVSFGDRIGSRFVPELFALSFYKTQVGYNEWEKWQNSNLNIQNNTQHYNSMKEWYMDQSKKINNANVPILVYDQRMDWFAGNWYFYRHAFYSPHIPVSHSSYLMLMVRKKMIELEGKEIYYIQVQDATRDSRAGLDELSQDFEKKVFQYVKNKSVEPIIIENLEKKPAFLIWHFVWK